MALPILGYERIIVITFLVVCIARKHASAPAENTLTVRLADSTAGSLVKNYKHKQILLTPININRSEPWSTKGNTASEPHLESNLADHIVSTPNLW
jgi:hypothetical protein